MSAIINAAPLANLQGIKDVSSRPPVIEPEVVPSHLPLFYLYAEKGPTEAQLVHGDSFTTTYGTRTLDPRSPYYNHQSVFANRVLGAGNAIMVQRVIPADAGPKSRLLLSLDIVAEPAIQQYQRNADGTYALDANGAKIPVSGAGATLPGYKAKWVVNEFGTDAFGAVTSRSGSIVSTDSQQSTLYPIMELEASFVGAYGNNLGLRLVAPTTRSGNPLNDTLASMIQAYLYRFQLVSRADASTSPFVVETLMGEQALDLTFKPGAINTINDTEVSIEDVLLDAYQDLATPGYPKQWGPFGRLKVYQDNLKSVLAMIGAAEAEFGLLSTEDITAASENLYEVNAFTGVNYDGVPYYTLQLLGPADEGVTFTDNTVLFAEGGSDGTMSFEAFDNIVRQELLNWGSTGTDYLDWARYPVSTLYDSGFTLDTKLAFAVPLGKRKDVWVAVSTQDISAPQNTPAEESSIAISLKTAFRNFPESEIFGTKVCRAVIIGHSGRLISDKYKGPQDNLLPLTLEFAVKCANFMGAGNGVWASGMGFDMPPNNQITLFRDVNATFKAATVRNKDWENGLVWAQNYDRRSLFWPAVQTVYDDDSSVLNGAITMMACVELQKVALRTWRDLSGISKLSAGQFIERSNRLIAAAVDGRFDDRFVIIPETYYTQGDEQRGYSWSCKIKIYAPNMKSVGTFSVEAHRLSDLEAGA